MSETRAAIDSLRSIVRLVAKLSPLPVELELTKALRRLNMENERPDRPQESFLIEVRRNLIAAAREGNPNIERFDCSVFDGNYVTGDIDDQYLRELAASRSDAAKKRRNAPVDNVDESNIVDLQNGN